ncbi:hypothetical protein ACCUM_2479 [Candidatus Accumulibacter phosphatis]|uniref:Uncharacterized protein n=1 Tax=Candidatus Accumulibacter phosphatis TaxID=327160 RepID=A0A5S4EI94_9PROT|nr:hypothetical protein ACCUM_2479 [Candidatus Accumulibacter phosphatis]
MRCPCPPSGAAALAPERMPLAQANDGPAWEATRCKHLAAFHLPATSGRW